MHPASADSNGTPAANAAAKIPKAKQQELALRRCCPLMVRAQDFKILLGMQQGGLGCLYRVWAACAGLGCLFLGYAVCTWARLTLLGLGCLCCACLS